MEFQSRGLLLIGIPDAALSPSAAGTLRQFVQDHDLANRDTPTLGLLKTHVLAADVHALHVRGSDTGYTWP